MSRTFHHLDGYLWLNRKKIMSLRNPPPRAPCLRHHFFQRPTVHRMSTGQRGQHALKSFQRVQICTTMLKSSAWHCAAFFSSSRSLNFCCALTCAIGAVLEQSSHEHMSNSAWTYTSNAHQMVWDIVYSRCSPHLGG